MIQNVDFIAGIIINLIKIQTNEQHTVWYIFQDLSINTSVVESPPLHNILYYPSRRLGDYRDKTVSPNEDDRPAQLTKYE